MWGFKSLLPCQFWSGWYAAGVAGRRATVATTMADREEITRGGSGEGGNAVSEFFRKLADYPKRFRQFVHETRLELKHVSWPTMDDVKSTTLVVVVTIFVFGAFLFVVDHAIGYVVQRVLTSFK
jgi:preprotein translocase subunit SecE